MTTLLDLQFITSRPTSLTLEPVATAAPQETPSVISVLEEKANGM